MACNIMHHFAGHPFARIRVIARSPRTIREAIPQRQCAEAADEAGCRLWPQRPQPPGKVCGRRAPDGPVADAHHHDLAAQQARRRGGLPSSHHWRKALLRQQRHPALSAGSHTIRIASCLLRMSLYQRNVHIAYKNLEVQAEKFARCPARVQSPTFLMSGQTQAPTTRAPRVISGCLRCMQKPQALIPWHAC